MIRYESVTDMCPESICAPAEPQPLTQALEDASIVYGHRVLPGRAARRPAGHRQLVGRLRRRAGRQARAAASRHRSDGARRTSSRRTPGGGAWAPTSAARSARPPSSAPSHRRDHRGAGAALRPRRPAAPAVGALADAASPRRSCPGSIRDAVGPGVRLREPHGVPVPRHAGGRGRRPRSATCSTTSRRLPELGRDAARGDVRSRQQPDAARPGPDAHHRRATSTRRCRVPLFIKAPGQTDGEVARRQRAEPSTSLPSIVDLLDADVDWEFDGHSLYDGSAATVAPRVAPDVRGRDRHRRPPGRRVPPRRRLDRPGRRRRQRRPRRSRGRRAAVGEPSESHASRIDQAEQFASLPTDAGRDAVRAVRRRHRRERTAGAGRGDQRPTRRRDRRLPARRARAGRSSGYVADLLPARAPTRSTCTRSSRDADGPTLHLVEPA